MGRELSRADVVYTSDTSNNRNKRGGGEEEQHRMDEERRRFLKAEAEAKLLNLLNQLIRIARDTTQTSNFNYFFVLCN